MVGFPSSVHMTVDKEKVENILRSDDFGINQVRSVVEDHDLVVSKGEVEPMIDALLASEWTEEQFEDLIDHFEEIQLEKSPWGYYVGDISDYPNFTDSPVHTELKEQLNLNPAKREDGELLREGFELDTVTESEITGIYWTQTQTFRLNALRKLTSIERTYDMGFDIDLENDIILINTDNYGKLNEMLKELRDIGLKIDPVGHHDLLHEDSLEQIDAFVSELKAGLRKAKAQQPITKYTDGESPPLLDIDVVKIRLESALKRANLEGHQDIFEHDVVRELTQEEKGRIVHLKGEFEFEEEDFNFHVGYTEKLGRVRIQKKGQIKRDVEVVEEAFNFIYDFYEDYFINY